MLVNGEVPYLASEDVIVHAVTRFKFLFHYGAPRICADAGYSASGHSVSAKDLDPSTYPGQTSRHEEGYRAGAADDHYNTIIVVVTVCCI